MGAVLEESREPCTTFIVKVMKTVPMIISLCFMSWSYYAYVLYTCYHAVDSLEVRAMELTVFHVLFFLLSWSFFKAILTRPNTPPDEFVLRDEELAELKKNDSRWCNNVLWDIAEKLPIATFKVNENHAFGIRYCHICKLVKPDRSHHCSMCRKCVLKMDHHCAVLNNCVSYSNYKFFILLLIYSVVICLFVVLTTVQHVIKFWIVNQENAPRPHDKNALMLFRVAVLFFIGLSLFLTYHFYLLSKNRTTNERFNIPLFKHGYDKNGFNLGCYKNIQQVFGKYIILWPFPIDTSLGDGVWFPTNEKESESQCFRNIIMRPSRTRPVKRVRREMPPVYSLLKQGGKKATRPALYDSRPSTR